MGWIIYIHSSLHRKEEAADLKLGSVASGRSRILNSELCECRVQFWAFCPVNELQKALIRAWQLLFGGHPFCYAALLGSCSDFRTVRSKP